VSEIEIPLTHGERVIGKMVGKLRRRETTLDRESWQPFGPPPEDKALRFDMVGACGELALSKYLDKYWSGALKWHECDCESKCKCAEREKVRGGCRCRDICKCRKEEPLDSKDVGVVQARSTERENGCLIVHEEDQDDLMYVLMIGPYPYETMTIKGWLPGGACKQSGWWRNSGVRTPAFFVPQRYLRNPSMLRNAFESERAKAR